MAVTIYDVAKLAGVGIGTVSRAINNSPHIRPATKARVMRAVEDLGYSPHALAKRLASRKLGILAAIMPFYTGHFYHELLRGIQEKMAAHGYDLLVYYVDKLDKLPSYLDKTLREKRCDGVLLISMDIDNSYIAKYAGTDFPLVAVDRASSAVDSIIVDNEAGAYAATRHLVNLGHTRIGMISGHGDSSPARERYHGYRRALEEAGLPVEEANYVPADKLGAEAVLHRNDGFNEAAGRAAMMKLLELGPGRPSAVFAAADILAVGAIGELRAIRMQIPNEMAIIGFDDIELAGYLSITTMQQPMFSMGELAVERLIEKIEGKDSRIRQICLPTRLIERSTTQAVETEPAT